MHELSIARAIVNEVVSQAQARNMTAVSVVKVRVGGLCGIQKDALVFGFDFAKLDGPLANASLEVEAVPIRIHCATCNDVVEALSTYQIACVSCHEPSSKIISGRELEITGFIASLREEEELVHHG